MTPVASNAPAFTREWALEHGGNLVLIALAALILLTIARFAVRRMQRRLEAAGSTKELDLQRAATVTQAISYVVRVAVWTVTILLVLGEFGLNVGPLIAGAGIAGVALGFGAQSIVKDFLSGFFFLLEDQFAIGDLVKLNAAGKDLEGRIEALSLRTTEVRDEDGALHVVANGNILVVSNRSRKGGPRPARGR